MQGSILGYIAYTTAEGDTFDTLALSAYNEERRASDILAANPDYCDVLIFDAGVKLRIPVCDTAATPQTLPPWRRSS